MAQLRIATEAVNPAVSGKAVNVMHMVSASSSLADAQACVDLLQTFYNAIKALYHTSTTITVGAHVIDYGVTPNVIVGTTPRTVTGTGSGTQLPAQLATVVSWRTGLASRSARGRSFLGPIASVNLNAYVLTPSIVTTIQTAADALWGSTRLFVFSPKLNTQYNVTQALTSNVVRTMRTRA